MSAVDAKMAWDHVGNTEAHRRTLAHYLQTTISSDAIVFQANAAIQRLYEARTAAKIMAEVGTDAALASAKGTMESVKRRMDMDEPKLQAAETEAVDGVVNRIAAGDGNAEGTSTATSTGARSVQ